MARSWSSRFHVMTMVTARDRLGPAGGTSDLAVRVAALGVEVVRDGGAALCLVASGVACCTGFEGRQPPTRSAADMMATASRIGLRCIVQSFLVRCVGFGLVAFCFVARCLCGDGFAHSLTRSLKPPRRVSLRLYRRDAGCATQNLWVLSGRYHDGCVDRNGARSWRSGSMRGL